MTYVTPSDPNQQKPLSGTITIGGVLKGCLIAFCILVLGAAIVIGALLLTGSAASQALLTQITNVLNPAPQASISAPQVILRGIQTPGQLVTVSSQLALADIYVGVEQGVLNACGFGANHVAQGTVEAGIELANVTADNIAYDAATNTYTITLPPPIITSCRVDYIRQYERTVTTCPVDWDEARLLANYLTLTEFRDAALEGGLLGQAEDQARLIIGNIVEGVLAGVQIDATVNVQVEPVPSGAAPALPDSCVPNVPAGWSVNANGRWVKAES
ncbi:MAG: DUF4230 domain-containing protein [Chloroflexota bacterium]|nr:DUF4230 domain-containing protein [Chloroflexota bacterium]